MAHDNVKIGYDNNSDDDIADAGDDIQVDDDFSSNVMSLSYGNNGNLTDDAVYKFVYDAWNRLVKAKRRVDAETVVATYAYLPDSRRIKKVVTNCGVENVANDGGNTTVRYYHDSQWRVVETHGSGLPTAQYVWGTQYTDELIFVDVNGDPTIAVANNCNPDVTTSKEAYETPPDARYFYHQDRNWNVVAISEYDTGETNNGRIVERYSYTPYGQFMVLAGDSGSGELGNLLPTSTTGNPFAQQGLPFDHEKGGHQNRNREYAPELQRFAQRDPSINGRAADLSIPVSLGANVYEYCGSAPTVWTDSLGLCHCCPPDYCVPDNPPPPPVCNITPASKC